MVRNLGTSMRIVHDDNPNIQGKSSLEFGSTYSPSHGSKPAALDDVRDTTISGLNGVSIKKLAAPINAVNFNKSFQESKRKNKSLAPWRSLEEFNTLCAAEKCSRYGKRGHWHRNYLLFSWAKRPANINVTLPKLENRFEGEVVDNEFLTQVESGKE